MIKLKDILLEKSDKNLQAIWNIWSWARNNTSLKDKNPSKYKELDSKIGDLWDNDEDNLVKIMKTSETPDQFYDNLEKFFNTNKNSSIVAPSINTNQTLIPSQTTNSLDIDKKNKYNKSQAQKVMRSIKRVRNLARSFDLKINVNKSSSTQRYALPDFNNFYLDITIFEKKQRGLKNQINTFKTIRYYPLSGTKDYIDSEGYSWKINSFVNAL